MSKLTQILERHIGRANAIKAADLAGYLEVNERELRSMVNEAIDAGVPVLSTTSKPAGYFLAQNRQEALDYTREIRSLSIAMFVRRKKVIRNAGLLAIPERQGVLI